MPVGDKAAAASFRKTDQTLGSEGDPHDELLEEIPDLRLERKRTHEIDFYLADRRLVLRIDGREIATTELPADQNERVPAQQVSTVAVLASGVGGHVERLRVFRDIHYTGAPHLDKGTRKPFSIGPDKFFAMGDNSPSSADSRDWGIVDRQNMLGRGFAIFWPAWPHRFEIGFIR